MTEREEIVRMLEEKRDLLIQTMKISDTMYSVPAEELNRRMNKCQALVDKMKLLDERIKRLCTETPVWEAVRGISRRDDLPEDLRQIFDAAAAVRVAAQRANSNADGIRERLQTERRQTQEEIRRLNTSSVSVAGRYGQAVRTGVHKVTVRPGSLRDTKI